MRREPKWSFFSTLLCCERTESASSCLVYWFASRMKVRALRACAREPFVLAVPHICKCQSASDILPVCEHENGRNTRGCCERLMPRTENLLCPLYEGRSCI